MENAIKKMSVGKATGQNGIAVKMLKVLDDRGKAILLIAFPLSPFFSDIILKTWKNA